jgi:ribosome maturation factor RimP
MSDLAPRSTPMTLDRPRLDAVLGPIARAHGAEVVDVEYKNDQGGWVLRVFVEKLGASENRSSTEQAAIDLSLCSDIAKELSPALDAVDVIPHRYHLEISSPGVERTLRGERDFIRFAGKKAKLKVHNAVRGQKVIVGLLGTIKNNILPVQDGAQTYEIALDNVATARLVFEFGPQPKPGKPGSKKKK